MRRAPGVVTATCAVMLAIGCGWSPASRAPARIEIVVDKIAFQQPEVHARVGDSVGWVNKDPVAHTSTSRKPAWDVTVEPGTTGHVVLKEAGTFDYYCRLHPNMSGRLIVAN
jgi:plastocyanin